MSLLRFGTGVILIGFLSGCAGLPVAHTCATLPVETVDRGLGEFAKVCAYEEGGRLVVRGSVWTQHVKAPTHIDIRLLAADGKVIEERREEIEPERSVTAHRCRHSYITSFPMSQVKQAARVQVIYHEEVHRG